MSSEDYATPSGRDLIAGRLPIELEVEGVPYRCVTGTRIEDLLELATWAQRVAAVASEGDPHTWLVVGRGDVALFGLSVVYIKPDGKITAVVETVGGGPVPGGLLVVGPDVDLDETRSSILEGTYRLVDTYDMTCGNY